jgi:hypothetical protein
MSNKPQINYLARDFDSIKDSLVQYAKRFYPNQYSDFTEASFGSFLLDAVAYIGDVTSFQLDYQSNENMLHTAINRDNIIKLARQLGYKEPLSPNVTGFISIYLNIPATSDNTGPRTDYLPVLKEGTSFSSTEGATFTLVEDIDFSLSDTLFEVSEVNTTTGIPSKYAAKLVAPIVSGVVETQEFEVSDRSSNDGFYKLEIEQSEIIEIISVIDLEGNTYYEVDSLSQDVVYVQQLNENSTSSNTIKVMKPIVAPRRFIVEINDDNVTLVFGSGIEDSNSTLDSVNDPTKVVLQKYGKDYVSSTILDPTVLNQNDKFGIGPSNTRLTVTYRYNTSDFLSAGATTLNTVSGAEFTFSTDATDSTLKNEVQASIEVENEERIAGANLTLSDDEIKQIAAGVYASQNRIVTLQDYVNFSYRMPAQFGRVRRATALRDDFSPRRSINLYVLSEDSNGNFELSSQAIKDNLKMWLSRNKTISDSVDILDGKIINFGLRFSFMSNRSFSLIDARMAAEQRIRDYFDRRKLNFGESINKSEIIRLVNDTEQVGDVLKMEFYSLSGGEYSDVEYDFIKNTTTDERYITIPDNYVFEIKLYNINITGEAL